MSRVFLLFFCLLAASAVVSLGCQSSQSCPDWTPACVSSEWAADVLNRQYPGCAKYVYCPADSATESVDGGGTEDAAGE